MQLAADDPIKGQGIATPEQLMITRLVEILGDVERRRDLVSAYFIPGERGTAFFTKLSADCAETGVSSLFVLEHTGDPGVERVRPQDGLDRTTRMHSSR